MHARALWIHPVDASAGTLKTAPKISAGMHIFLCIWSSAKNSPQLIKTELKTVLLRAYCHRLI